MPVTNPIVNADGQPQKALYYHRLIDRQITEMLGMARGVICDGVLNDTEIVAFRQWLAANPDVTVGYPGKQLANRVLKAVEYGVIEDDERAELKEFLLDLVGEPADLTGSMRDPSTLPFDAPPPTLFFDGWEYVFTGTLAHGSRAWAEQQVRERGGTCGKTVTKRTRALVVGMFASEAWVQSTHGRKVEKAIHLREFGQPIVIVSEQHWAGTLNLGA